MPSVLYILYSLYKSPDLFVLRRLAITAEMKTENRNFPGFCKDHTCYSSAPLLSTNRCSFCSVDFHYCKNSRRVHEAIDCMWRRLSICCQSPSDDRKQWHKHGMSASGFRKQTPRSKIQHAKQVIKYERASFNGMQSGSGMLYRMSSMKLCSSCGCITQLTARN